MADKGPGTEGPALARAAAIADELRDLETRIREGVAPEVAVTLLEQATELAEEAARLLEDAGREEP